MWAVFVEPGNVCRYVIPHRFQTKWNDQAQKPLLFEGFDEPLDHGDAAISVDGPVERMDVLSPTPFLEAGARELH